MKAFSIFCLSALVFASTAMAQQVASYPEQRPVIDLSFPDDWTLTTKSGVLYAHPSEDKGFFITLGSLSPRSADQRVALNEIKDDIEGLFRDVEYQKPETVEAGDLTINLINAKGTDEAGKANINIWLIYRDGEDATLALQCISSQQAFEKYADVAGEIINSILPHGEESNAPANEAETSVQTYSYPDAENPILTMDLPADWTVATQAQGFQVHSADKLFVATVTPLSTDLIMDAMDTIGQMLTKTFETCVWNGGGKPKTSLDEKTGYSLTENTGVGVRPDRAEFLLRLNQYARVGSDVFFIMSTQVRADAEEANADGTEMMLSSIRYK